MSTMVVSISNIPYPFDTERSLHPAATHPQPVHIFESKSRLIHSDCRNITDIAVRPHILPLVALCVELQVGGFVLILPMAQLQQCSLLSSHSLTMPRTTVPPLPMVV